jgi:hypothetical protein
MKGKEAAPPHPPRIFLEVLLRFAEYVFLADVFFILFDATLFLVVEKTFLNHWNMLRIIQ